MRLVRRLAAAAILLGGILLAAPAPTALADQSAAPSPSPTQTPPTQCAGLTGPALGFCLASQVPGNVVGGAVQFGADQAVIAVTKWVAAGATSLIGEIAKGLKNESINGQTLEQIFLAAGAKIVTPARDVEGLFKLGFVEDPWGTRLEITTWLSDFETAKAEALKRGGGIMGPPDGRPPR